MPFMRDISMWYTDKESNQAIKHNQVPVWLTAPFLSLDLTHASISYQQTISYFSYIRSEFYILSEFCSSVFRAPVDSVDTVLPYCCSALIYSMVMDVWTMILFRANLVGGNQCCRETHCLRHRGTRGVWCVWGQQACATRWYQSNRLHCIATYLLIYLLTYLLTYILACLHTCLLTPWRRVLLEKLTGSRLVKKFYAFHGSRRFIIALTSARHLSVSWARSISKDQSRFEAFLNGS